ncbi:MAG TPA: fumarylacetoacetate hydrolase family protein [Afifellaceae bacterium]|nr:fumarylacetoacetate hydrolase family protein [Afifellaceae bacterium]
MRLMSFEIDGRPRYGIAREDGIVDLTDALGAGRPDLLSVIRAGEAERLGEAAGGKAAGYQLSEIKFLSPIPNPEKILCVGVNYLGRNEEYPDPKAARYPSLFYRHPGSIVGHDVPIERPRATNEFDYEGEVALIVGRDCRYVSEDRALDVVLGATICQEGTVHDWLRHGKFNSTQGKNFDRTGSIGPWIVTRDEIDLEKPLEITTRVNGEVRQKDTTDRMIFDFARLISYITSFATLRAGDILVTGTPTGTGRWLDPPQWLVAGDVVEVSVPEIGVLRNEIVDEQ